MASNGDDLVSTPLGRALEAVFSLETEAGRSDLKDYRAEMLWAAARILRARHHLGLDDLDH